MIFDHDVKVNGKWYEAGTFVPVSTSVEKKPETVEEKVEVAESTENTTTKRSSKKK